jgi:preprotein translocase subunit SecE
MQEFFKNSWEEVTKEVTWPKWSDLQSSATLVLVASLIFALVVGVIDFLIENGLRLFYQSI